MGDLVAAFLPGEGFTAQPPECLQEEVVHVVGMDAARHRPLHLLAQIAHLAGVHPLLHQGTALQ